MLRLNQQARGLLTMLGIAAGGRSPPEFAEEFVRPTLDMTPFLSADTLKLVFENQTVLAGTEIANFTWSVPQGYTVLVRSISAIVNLPNNGDRAQPGLSLGGWQFPYELAPGALNRIRLGLGITTTNNMVGAGGVHAIFNYNPPQLMPLMAGRQIIYSGRNMVLATDATLEFQLLGHFLTL